MPLKKLSLGVLSLLIPMAAQAELGGDSGSVQADQSQLRAIRHAVPSNGYTVHELITENQITVREYATTQGKIFAVSWRGPFMPDLQQLLGSYFPTFKAAASARRAAGARGPLTLEQDDLVIQSGGHMRAFNGRAYVPSLLPPQVSFDEIQ